MIEEPEDQPWTITSPVSATLGELIGKMSLVELLTPVILAFINVWTLLPEMVMRRKFGSRYFNLFSVIASIFAMNAFGVATTFLKIFDYVPNEKVHTHPALIGTGTVWILFYVLLLYHIFRVRKLMLHRELEFDSMDDGPGWAIFRKLPKANSWMRVRVWYEPITICLVALVLGVTHIIHLYVFLLMIFCAIIVQCKAVLMSYDSWCYLRNVDDKQNRAKMIQRIYRGHEPPPTIGGRALSYLPETPEQRAEVAAKLAGFSNSEYSHLISEKEVVA